MKAQQSGVDIGEEILTNKREQQPRQSGEKQKATGHNHAMVQRPGKQLRVSASKLFKLMVEGKMHAPNNVAFHFDALFQLFVILRLGRQ